MVVGLLGSRQIEKELLEIAHEEGFDIEYVVRSNHDDWDRYEAGNWYALVRWIEENPDHPERQEVIDHLHSSQELYFKYNREYLGWAMYVLSPALYWRLMGIYMLSGEAKLCANGEGWSVILQARLQSIERTIQRSS